MYQDVFNFWFDELQPQQWWVKDVGLDSLIMDRFLPLYGQAKNCELFAWREVAEGRLAEIIVLDQFPRNMFRDTAQAFATDSLGLALAQEAVSSGADQKLNQTQRSFLYMPFMHSESLVVHEIAVDLFEQNGNESSYDYELKHKRIIEQFGRYPHRNRILGRESTAEEVEFLKQPGSGF
jgi:uncharacterized protein (DUF924 family)